MFDFVHKHRRLIQLVLGLMIIPPFAFWGIQSYDSMRTSVGEVADVGGQKITEQEFTTQLRSQQERLRSMLATDSTLWLDVCGQAYYVEESVPGAMIDEAIDHAVGLR